MVIILNVYVIIHAYDIYLLLLIYCTQCSLFCHQLMEVQEGQTQETVPVQAFPYTRTGFLTPDSICNVQDQKNFHSHQMKCDPTWAHLNHLRATSTDESAQNNTSTKKITTPVTNNDSPRLLCDNERERIKIFVASNSPEPGGSLVHNTGNNVLLAESEATQTAQTEQQATSDTKKRTRTNVMEEAPFIVEEQLIQGNDFKGPSMEHELAQESCLKGGQNGHLEIQQPICTNNACADEMQSNDVQKGNLSYDILTVGSFAIVSYTNPPIFGTIRWIGTIIGISGLMAGLELVSDTTTLERTFMIMLYWKHWMSLLFLDYTGCVLCVGTSYSKVTSVHNKMICMLLYWDIVPLINFAQCHVHVYFHT